MENRGDRKSPELARVPPGHEARQSGPRAGGLVAVPPWEGAAVALILKDCAGSPGCALLSEEGPLFGTGQVVCKMTLERAQGTWYPVCTSRWKNKCVLRLHFIFSPKMKTISLYLQTRLIK